MLNKKLTIRNLLILIAIFFSLPAIVIPAPEVIFITNMNNPDSTLTKKEIRDIFMGDKSAWSDGSKIYFSIIRKGATHNQFLKTYINMSPKNFVRYWKRQILTGKATKLKLANTEDEIVKYVSKNNGGIGYVSSTVPIGDLKILKISE